MQLTYTLLYIPIELSKYFYCMRYWYHCLYELYNVAFSILFWVGALGIKPMAKNILEPHSFVVITHSPKIYFKLYNIIQNVFRPEDAQTLLTIAEDFEFDSLEMSDTKKFFVLFKEYLHAVIDNQQMYVLLSFIYQER